MVAELLSYTEHRPWPVPKTPWIMTQSWTKLLFAHWPLPAEVLRPLIPHPLMLDTHKGQAWIGVIPFDMANRLRGVPCTMHFRELNVRTYVTYDNKPGVFFFSLDASHWLSVMGARWMYALPYHLADMSLRSNQNTIFYESRRTRHQAPTPGFQAEYEPLSPCFRAEPGSLANWLTERYCLYALDRSQRLCRADVHHKPWPLQEARAEIRENTMSPVPLPATPPLLHYSARVDVVVWPLVPLVKAGVQDA